MLPTSTSPSNQNMTAQLMSMMVLAMVKQRAASTQTLQSQVFNNSFSSTATTSSKAATASQSKASNKAVATLMDMVKVLNQATTGTNEKNEAQLSMKDLDMFKMKLEKEVSTSPRRENSGNSNGFSSEEELRKLIKITDLLLENFNAIARLDGDDRYITRQDLINAAALSGDPLTLDENDLSILKNSKNSALPESQMPWWVASKASEQSKAAGGSSQTATGSSMAAAASPASGAPGNAFRLPTEGTPTHRPEEVKPYSNMGGGGGQQNQDDQRREQREEKTAEEEQKAA